MTNEDICFAPASTLVPLVKSKKLSPVELTQAILDRIEKTNDRVNAFATLDAEGALAQARCAEEALIRGEELGPLHGITVTIKDLAEVAGLPMEAGSLKEAGKIAHEDAPMVSRLRAAGAIVLGKTTTSEFGWSGVSRCPSTGITHNPWGYGLNAGASSAGAGAAAAAGYGPLHQGSDGGGSIRMPAHFCGVFGLKPTYGRVPHAPPPNNDYMAHNGPMTRTVMDSAMMLQVMAGPHAWDQTSLEASPLPYAELLHQGFTLKGKRIAISPDLGHARVDPDVAELFRRGVQIFEDLGAVTDEVLPAWAKDGPELIREIWPAHRSIHLPDLPTWADKMDPGLVACAKEARNYSVSEYCLLRKRKIDYGMAVNRWFEDWDYFLTPAASTAAFPVDRLQPPDWPHHSWDWIQWAEFSYPFNISQNPAASVPCGFNVHGLPVGLQIVGRRFDDLGVLQASAAFERAQPWSHRRPPV